MDIDENDILYTNTFVSNQESTEVPTEYNNEFKKYYENEREKLEETRLRESIERMSIRSMHLDDDNDAGSIMHTNRFTADAKSILAEGTERKTDRYKKEIKTYVSVDSRDRPKDIFSKPNFFKIFLGKTFTNVKTIRLVSIEFPNTNAVINSTNNRIYWRNQEDIDDDIIDPITQTHPVYNVELRIGSYIVTSLQTEISQKLASIKRRNKFGDYHYFVVDLDIDTDIVEFTSLVLTQLPNNPISVTTGLGIVTINAPSHGFVNGQTVYIVGGKNLAGINASVINGPHEITVINSNTFQYEVNVKAGETAIGGGNTVKSGTLAPFQLLFGKQPYTVAQNIGFALENSSQRIDTSIKSIENLYQVQITTKNPHGFLNSYDYIGNVCLLNNTSTTPNIDGNRVITRIINDRIFLISVSSNISFPTFNSGFVTFQGRTLDIERVGNYDVDTVLVTTFTDHRLDPDDLNRSITFYNTTTTPDLNGVHVVYGVISSTQLVVPGSVLELGSVDVSTPGEAGTIRHHDPITTLAYNVSQVTPARYTMFTCENHEMKVGDNIRIYNLVTDPQIPDSVFAVQSVPDTNTFTIDFKTTSYDINTLSMAKIGTDIITLSFPYHGFNKIINISNGAAGKVVITTQLPHNIIDGQNVRLSNTNSVPSIDGGNYVVTLTSDDSFEIDYPPGLVSSGDEGVIGMSNAFILYGVESVGGIDSEAFNNREHMVRDIIDKHTIKFNVTSYATETKIGGGDNLYVSSLLHGFSGMQDNTKNSLLNRSINLEGENYAFLCCPQLSTMMNTGDVRNIFARITLDQSPGSVVFAFLSNPKNFDTVPLDKLNELEFSIVNYDNTLYEFNDLDYSFVLEITEVVDTTDAFNMSSKRGINNR